LFKHGVPIGGLEEARTAAKQLLFPWSQTAVTNREWKDMPDWIASALSREQRRPVTRTTANVCILAAAGSGKTRTLVHLLAADLASGIPASGIVAFTFTEKAAEELLARIHILAKMHLADLDLTGMYVGTIHAWCLQYLLAQSDFYDLTPLDELQLDAFVSRLYDTLELEFVKRCKVVEVARQVPRRYRSLLQRAPHVGTGTPQHCAQHSGVS